MHSYIITSADIEAIDKKVASLVSEWNVSPFDIYTIEKDEEKKDISIQQIRLMAKQAMLTPTQGQFLVIVIKEAHRMTIAAQNALLKTLEEPPKRVKILLTSNAPDALLETIRSRCEKIIIPGFTHTDIKNTVSLDTLFSFEHESVSQTFANIDAKTTTSQASREFIDEAISVLHTAICSKNPGNYSLEKCSNLAKILLKIKEQLGSNVNHKLALDCGFLEARQGQ